MLEGSALLVGNRVRVSVQLISARTDETLWADRYDRELEDVLGLQSELAETVAREIAIKLTPNEATQLAKRGPVNPEAHLEYSEGPALVLCRDRRRRSSSGCATRGARSSSIPTSRWRGRRWPTAMTFRAIRGMAPPAEAFAEATAAAHKALELDPSLADAHASLGVIRSHSGDLAGGMRALRHADRAEPGLAPAHDLLGRALYAYERHAEALAAMHKAVSLDPLSM